MIEADDLQRVEVDNPFATDALLYAEVEEGKRRTPGVVYSTEPNMPRQTRKVRVDRNMRTLIGGLVTIRRRTQLHEKVAERFLNLYEARYGSQMPAVDASRVQVDTSIVGHDGARVAALDATYAIREAETYLGEEDFERIVHVVCLQAPVSHSRFLKAEPRGRALEAEVDRFLAALDRLAVHWRYATRNAA